MNATPFEFRYRFWLFLLIYTLGFVAPWDFAFHLDSAGPNAHVWGLLSAFLAKSGAISISAAFNLLLAVAILCAFFGAGLRTWGAACLGTGVVRDTSMRGDRLVSDGPYRYVRNPLYLGSWLTMLALALLMPASGAIFTIVLVVIFQLRRILGEEAFLRAKLGDAYIAYCAHVPRLLPAPTPRMPASRAQPHWMQAILAEIFYWGITVSFAVLGWRYNAELLIQCVLVSLGVSLIVKAFVQPEQQPRQQSAA